MQRSSLAALACAAALASCLYAPGVVRAQTTYTLTQVGTNDGTTNTSVSAINDRADLALTVNSGSIVSAQLWRQGTQTNIGGLAPSPQFVESGGLNDQVQIVGTTLSPTSGNFTAFVWQQGHMAELPTPAGTTAAFAIKINLLGQIVGQVFDANFNSHAALWSQGKLTLLPGIPGNISSDAVGINIRGEIIGISQDATNVASVVVWRRGTPTVLVDDASPNAINDEGQIVGVNLGSQTPFLWQNGVTTQLPALPGTSGTGTAEAINDLGQIVGSESNIAVLWQNSVTTDLNAQVAKSDPLQPFVRLQSAAVINNLGQIAASGVDSRSPGIGRWYLLSPAH